MKITLYNYKNYILILLFLLFVILLYFFNNKFKEPFLPRINKIYRPYVRNTRLYTTKKAILYLNKMNIFFKKIGFL